MLRLLELQNVSIEQGHVVLQRKYFFSISKLFAFTMTPRTILSLGETGEVPTVSAVPLLDDSLFPRATIYLSPECADNPNHESGDLNCLKLRVSAWVSFPFFLQKEVVWF